MTRKFENTRAFQFIDSEEKAYWLGFLSADGSATHGQLRLTLKESDSEHILKFRKFMQSSNKVTIVERSFYDGPKFKQHQIALRSKDLIEDLRLHGVYSGKAKTINIPKMDESLVRHWRRGYFDGDGCITYAGNNAHMSVLGGEVMLRQWQEDWVSQAICNKTKIFERPDGVFVMQYGGNKQLKRMMINLYEGSKIYLDRKYELATDIING